VEVHHPEKDPRPNKKAKKLIEEGQSTLDEFVGQTEVPSKVSVIKLFITENKDFRNMIKLLNSDALVPKADTIKNDMMGSFEEEREKRKDLLQVNI